MDLLNADVQKLSQAFVEAGLSLAAATEHEDPDEELDLDAGTNCCELQHIA